MIVRKAVVATVVLATLLSGCTSSTERRTTILVSAAASLGSAFTEIAAAFEAEHADVIVDLNFGGSTTLQTQIIGGAPVDVFASADIRSMEGVVDVSVVDSVQRVFATNTLTIAVPKGNPGGLTGIEDFSRRDLFLGLCAVPVPCGIYAHEVLDNAGVVASIDTEESDVASLVFKIELGELDAGIVYKTDAETGQEGIQQISIPDEYNVTAVYPIALLSADSHDANAFVQFVLSDRGQEILVANGFGIP